MKYSNSREQAKESEMQHSKEESISVLRTLKASQNIRVVPTSRESISVLRTLKASESAMQHSKAFDDMKKRYLKASESAMQHSKEESLSSMIGGGILALLKITNHTISAVANVAEAAYLATEKMNEDLAKKYPEAKAKIDELDRRLGLDKRKE